MREFNFFKTFILDPIFNFIYFPVWWYRKGLIKFVNFLKRKIEEIAQPFVLRILFQNLFKPMYADCSREGRIISFFMRIFLLCWRLLKILIVSLLALLALLIYLISLPLIFYEIICFLSNSCQYFLFPSFI